MNILSYILHVKYQNKVVRADTGKKRRFLHHIASVNWKLCPSVYLRVNYKHGHNDGDYTNRHDLVQAFRAFTEV